MVRVPTVIADCFEPGISIKNTFELDGALDDDIVGILTSFPLHLSDSCYKDSSIVL